MRAQTRQALVLTALGAGGLVAKRLRRGGGRSQPALRPLSRVPDPIEQRIDVGGVGTRALTVPGEGPTIVLFHGFGDSADTWRPLLGELAALGRHAVAVDLPHFGCADRPRSVPVLAGFDAFAAALVREVDEGDEGDGVVLAGNSLGGYIALRAARDPSLPLRAVVGIGPAGLGFAPWMAALPRLWGSVIVASRIPVGDARRTRGLVAFYLRAGMGRYAARDLAERWAAHIGPGDLRRVLALARDSMADSLADPIHPQDLVAPVTLVYGSADPLCPPAAGRAFADARPGTAYIVYDGAGHATQLDEPHAIAEMLAELAESDGEPFAPTGGAGGSK